MGKRFRKEKLMIIIELDKQDIEEAEKICELSEESIIIEEPNSFSSDLNTFVQIGITLAPSAISAIVLILTELIRNRKHVRVKIDGLELEGLSVDKTLEIVEKYLKEKRDEKAKEELTKLLSIDVRR